MSAKNDGCRATVEKTILGESSQRSATCRGSDGSKNTASTGAATAPSSSGAARLAKFFPQRWSLHRFAAAVTARRSTAPRLSGRTFAWAGHE